MGVIAATSWASMNSGMPSMTAVVIKSRSGQPKSINFYKDAAQNNQFIDKYAASSDSEFFAQDMAAYYLSGKFLNWPDPDTNDFKNIIRAYVKKIPACMPWYLL